jgi:hypothetical protein
MISDKSDEWVHKWTYLRQLKIDDSCLPQRDAFGTGRQDLMSSDKSDDWIDKWIITE